MLGLSGTAPGRESRYLHLSPTEQHSRVDSSGTGIGELAMRVSAEELALLLTCFAAVWVQEKCSPSTAAAVRKAHPTSYLGSMEDLLTSLTSSNWESGLYTNSVDVIEREGTVSQPQGHASGEPAHHLSRPQQTGELSLPLTRAKQESWQADQLSYHSGPDPGL